MEYSKEVYAPLLHEHELCSCCEQNDLPCPATRRTSPWRTAAVVLLVLSNVALATLVGTLLRRNEDSTDTGFTGIEFPQHRVHSEWWSTYSIEHENQTEEVDAAWAAMRPAHGFVAVDPQWAAERQLLPSMELPSDRSKHVYILEAYHLLHCLKVIRKTFYQVKRGEPTSFRIGHADHCLDALRQNIMCHADDSLLYTFGRGMAGDGQARQCRDWNALKDWATEHTACYRDHEEKEAGQFFRCDDGRDGLIMGSPEEDAE